MRHLGRGLLVPGCLAAALDRRQRGMPACRTSQRKCVETRGGYSCRGKMRKRSAMEWPCERWSSRLMEDWSTKLLRDLVTTAGANGQCSPHAVGRWRTQLERVLLTAEADTYLRALGSRVAERPAAEPLLLLAELIVQSFFSCEGSSDRETDR